MHFLLTIHQFCIVTLQFKQHCDSKVTRSNVFQAFIRSCFMNIMSTITNEVLKIV